VLRNDLREINLGMPTYRYFLSSDPTSPAPPEIELQTIEADDQASALEKIKRDNRRPKNWPSVWAHILVWSEGELRGFESTRIG
jgi:hypothetical protein